MPRRNEDAGTCLPGPLRTRWIYDSDNTDTTSGAPARREFEAEVYRWNNRLRVDRMDDFDSEYDYTDVELPLVVTTSSVAADVGKALVSVTTSQVSSADFIVTRGGQIQAVNFLGEHTLATDNTNFVTFAGINKLAAGSGTTVLDAASAADTTKTTGGGAWTACVPFGLTLTATTANLRVTEGDVLNFKATVSGTLANQVEGPSVQVRIRHANKGGLRPRITRTAGQPAAVVQLDSANGEFVAALSATNEVQFAGVDWGNQLVIPGNKRFYFETAVKFNTTTGANESFVAGLATSYNSTLASISKFARFRTSGDAVLKYESADGTTTNTTAALSRGGITLAASTYYLFTIDGRKLDKVRFFVNDTQFATADMSALTASDLFQPLVGVHKASGTGTPNISIDWVRVSWDRV